MMQRWLLASLALALLPRAEPSRAEDDQAIRGTLAAAPGLAHHVGPDDRLIIKLYHPGDGVELDAKYQIVARFTLPFAFRAAPSIDMNAHQVRRLRARAVHRQGRRRARDRARRADRAHARAGAARHDRAAAGA